MIELLRNGLEHAVKNHLKSTLSKVDANDRAHAVTIALKRGFVNL